TGVDLGAGLLPRGPASDDDGRGAVRGVEAGVGMGAEDAEVVAEAGRGEPGAAFRGGPAVPAEAEPEGEGGLPESLRLHAEANGPHAVRRVQAGGGADWERGDGGGL